MKRSSETAPRIGAARSEAGRVLGEVSGSDRNADARLGASRNWRMRRMRKRGDTERREDKEIRGYERRKRAGDNRERDVLVSFSEGS